MPIICTHEKFLIYHVMNITKIFKNRQTITSSLNTKVYDRPCFLFTEIPKWYLWIGKGYFLDFLRAFFTAFLGVELRLDFACLAAFSLRISSTTISPVWS